MLKKSEQKPQNGILTRGEIRFEKDKETKRVKGRRILGIKKLVKERKSKSLKSASCESLLKERKG